VLSVVAVLVAAGSAVAGPPLLCHPFDIGDARSLPWDGTTSWFDVRDDYRLSNLVADTESLLTPETPVIVRMETLRRAAIYASRDNDVAARLMRMLEDRSRKANANGGNSLAGFDEAYVIEAYRQLTMTAASVGRRADLQSLIAGKDGYPMVKEALEGRPDDASLDFAAALFAASKDRVTHGSAYAEHARKARKGASRDALLAKNIGQLG
jgi:hypothetical protein